MPTLYTPALNAYLREQLTALGCRRGTFNCTGDGAKCRLTGTSPDGRAAFQNTFAPDFTVGLVYYLTHYCPPATSRLTIHLDLDADTFRYELTTHATAARPAAAEIELETADRRRAPRDAAPYGRLLAEQVADALRQGGGLGYGHRDYCGRGLEYAAGEYRYGEIWDGSLSAHRTFADRESFVAWLTQQSDASLAGLEAKDPWLWDNQTVTRQRLEALVRGYQ